MLRRKLEGHRSLMAYTERIASDCFAAEVQIAPLGGIRWSEWEAASGTGRRGTDRKYSKQKSEQELELQRKGRLWLAGATCAIVAYIIFSGDYLQLTSYLGELGEDDDGEDLE